jgi:hypothetical protein
MGDSAFHPKVEHSAMLVQVYSSVKQEMSQPLDYSQSLMIVVCKMYGGPQLSRQEQKAHGKSRKLTVRGTRLIDPDSFGVHVIWFYITC